MDLVYPHAPLASSRGSSDPGRRRLLGKSSFVSLILVTAATFMAIVSVVLSVVVWERSRSYVEATAWSDRGRICLPCESVLDSESSGGERQAAEFFHLGERQPSGRATVPPDSSRLEASKQPLSPAVDDICCAEDARQQKFLLTMFWNVHGRKRKIKEVQKRGRSKKCHLRHTFASTESSSDGTPCITGLQSPAKDADGSVHLTLTSLENVESTSKSGASLEILQWTNPSALAGNVENRLGKVFPKDDGIYFVYCQVYLVEYDADDDDDRTKTKPKSITVYINRYDSKTDASEVVVERTVGRCSKVTLTEASHCEYTVYTASLLRLGRSDALGVTVSHRKLINRDSKSTFFGLYKVT